MLVSTCRKNGIGDGLMAKEIGMQKCVSVSISIALTFHSVVCFNYEIIILLVKVLLFFSKRPLNFRWTTIFFY